MSTGAHPRIEARRRGVAEQSARRRLRWVLAALFAAFVGAMGHWVVQSPLLALDRFDVRGDLAADEVAAVAAAAGVEVGDPIIFVRPGRLRDHLLADPRVADARVTVRYPHEVAIDVLAHRPVAWLRAAPASWLHVTPDGHVVAVATSPGAGPTVEAPTADLAAGDRLSDPEALAALAFVAALPDDVAGATTVTAADGVLAATVAGHDVVLGAPTRMVDKAAVVAALLADATAGTALDVTAPDRPAMTATSDESELEVEAEG